MSGSSLTAYQRRVRDDLAGTRSGMPPLGGADVVRWSVHQWGAALLRTVCPLTATLLLLRGRYADEVTRHLARPGRPAALHTWGLLLLEHLATDPDPLVADVARLEHAMTAPVAQRLASPDPWVWTRQPESVLLLLAQGGDPEQLPLLAVPVTVGRDATGRLVTTPAPDPAAPRQIWA